MLTLKKKLIAIIFLAFLSSATLISCGTQGKEEQATEENAKDSTDHPADSTEHPEGEHPEGEHPADSTENQ